MTSPIVPICIELAPADDHYCLDEDISLISPEEFLHDYSPQYAKFSASALFSLEQQSLSPVTYDDGQNMIYSPASLQPPAFGWSPGSSTSEVSDWSCQWGSHNPSPNVASASNLSPELNGLCLMAEYSPGIQVCQDAFAHPDQHQTCNPQQTWYTDAASELSYQTSLSPLPLSPHTALPNTIEPLSSSPVESVPPSPASSYGMPISDAPKPYTRPDLRVNTRFISRGVEVSRNAVRRAISSTPPRSVVGNKRKVREDDDDAPYHPRPTRRQSLRQSTPSSAARSPLSQSSSTFVFENNTYAIDLNSRREALLATGSPMVQIRRSVGSERHCEAAKQRRKKEPQFWCHLCSRGFTAKHNLDSHINGHLGIKPYTCKDCPQTFTTSRASNRHHNGACARGRQKLADARASGPPTKRLKSSPPPPQEKTNWLDEEDSHDDTSEGGYDGEEEYC